MNQLNYHGYHFYQERTSTNSIFIMNQSCIEELSPNSKNCYIVSITSPGSIAEINDSPHLLRVSFFDSEEGENSVHPGISQEQAANIADFIKTVPVDKDIFIHCEAGKSRSAGVAAAIIQYQKKDPKDVFNQLTPSMRCYTNVLKALLN